MSVANDTRGIHSQGDEDSVFLFHEACPSCGSRDNLGRYSDGHAHCFGCGYYEKGDGTVSDQKIEKIKGDLIHGEVAALTKRHISEETCARWGYKIGKLKGKPVQLAPYYKDGVLVAQKVRFANKDFKFLGETKGVELFGQSLWRDSGRMLVITEGEIDALSVSQAQGNKYPVVSVPTGAQGAKKAIQTNLEFVERFDKVVFMFDMDEVGQKAAIECAQLLTPGKAAIASLPLKDANELLKKGRVKDIIDSIWGARVYRPDGIVTLSDLREEVLKPVEIGLPWPWAELTKATYGRRYGEVYAMGAGTGVGKTDWFTQTIVHTAVEQNEMCGVLYLEQPPVETGKRLVGKFAGKRFHVPDGSWTQEELNDAFDAVDRHPNIILYDAFGASDWDIIKARIRYLVRGLGCKHIFLDHLTALAAAEDDERKALEHIMADIAGMAQEMKFCFYFISHLATPEGKPHEEGGRVMIRHFKGSRAIGYWSHFMFALERDQQANTALQRSTSTFRILKDRYTGESTGDIIFLAYDHNTGLLSETDVDPYADDDDHTTFNDTEEDY